MRASASLFLVTILCTAPAIHASLPPDEQWLEIGTDSRGKSWSLLIVRSGPEGPRSSRLAGDVSVDIPAEPYVGEPRIWTVDKKDRLWVFSENGRGFRYDIKSRKLQHLAIPVRQQVSASLQLRGDTLWFQEYDWKVGSSISKWSPGEAAVKRVFTAPRDLNLEGYAIGPSTLWISAAGRGANHPLLRIAIDPQSGAIQKRFDATVSGTLDSGTRSHMMVDGDVLWITHPPAGRIERMERSGGHLTWDIGPYAPSDLLTIGGRAVAIGRQGKWAEVGPIGPEQNQWTTTACRIFVLDPKASKPGVSAPLNVSRCGAPLSIGADGKVKLGTATVTLQPVPRIE